MDRIAAYIEAKKAYLREYYKRNKDRLSAKMKEYNAANKDRARVARHRRRAAKAGGKASPDIAQRLLVLQRGKCANCRCSIRNGYHIDHITPLSRGGEHSDGNLQLLCPPCNLRKNAKDPIEWAKSQGRLL